MSRPSLRASFEVLVLPFQPDGRWLVGPKAAAVVFVTDPERRIVAWDDLLMRLYGLTPTEARVAVRLLKGERVQDIAEELAVTMNTARTHLKHIFAKTGARSQSDLVRMLLSGPAQLRVR